MVSGLGGALIYICGLVLCYFLLVWGSHELSINIPANVLKIIQIILVVLGIIRIAQVFGI